MCIYIYIYRCARGVRPVENSKLTCAREISAPSATDDDTKTNPKY